MSADLRSLAPVVAGFLVEGVLIDAAPHPGGHINRSYVVTCCAAGLVRRYLLQRINQRVFADPRALMHNVARVTDHYADALHAPQRRQWETPSPTPDVSHPSAQSTFQPAPPSLVRTHSDETFTVDESGGVWRMFTFVERARVYESVATPHQAREAGRAFGRFQRFMADLPAGTLTETLPGFHDTLKRLRDFEDSVRENRAGRAASAATEIEAIRRRRALAEDFADRLAAGAVPRRVVHNDAKITNVLFDAETDVALWVVDLDTVMPGYAMHDFGDMMRTMVSPHEEDDTDLSRVEVRLDLFAALTEGYLSEAGAFLTAAERDLLVPAGPVVTLEQAARFLADHLDGDVYYAIQRPGQNLDRARVQLRLLDSMSRREPGLRRIATEAASG